MFHTTCVLITTTKFETKYEQQEFDIIPKRLLSNLNRFSEL